MCVCVCVGGGGGGVGLAVFGTYKKQNNFFSRYLHVPCVKSLGHPFKIAQQICISSCGNDCMLKLQYCFVLDPCPAE